MSACAISVAALYVQTGGVYFGVAGVDPWDEDRDARQYDGPYPVVAHPPCTSWSAWRAPTRETMYGHPVGEDGGCFVAALASVRQFGGVLEHPAHSLAWVAHGLPEPLPGGWTLSMLDGVGWVCEVAQVEYGHRAEKMTWLYYIGPDPPPLDPPMPGATPTMPADLQWGPERSRTPPLFRDALLEIALSARPMVAA